MVLVARAVQLQVIQRKTWSEKAAEALSTVDLVPTTRGRLLDRLGRPIANESPCIDASVDYRAIPREAKPEWLLAQVRSRLAARLGREYTQADKATRLELVKQETIAMQAQIEAMWHMLADRGKMSIDQIDDIRQSIIRKVEMRRRIVWYGQYQRALALEKKRDPSPWYQRWLVDESSDGPDLDEFIIEVAEQTQAHVILPAISDETANYLLKNQQDFPGLVLQRGTRRNYPYNDAAAHLIGHLSYARPEDVKRTAGNEDELSKYLPNDLIGRSGLEAMCEPLLRGKLGKIEKTGGETTSIRASIPPTPGQDVRTTIDVELQQDIAKLFERVSFSYGPALPSTGAAAEDTLRMPGAAVVLDVATNEVIALVSYPSYNLNTMDENYSRMAADVLEYPLLNRATQVAMEPGSTAKPIVGIGAITDGIIAANETVECDGFFHFNGRKIPTGRCWTESTVTGGAGAHHAIPWQFPHPNGFLSFSDALERSCNIYFETAATKMGVDELHKWFDKFGLGRATGIGISEIPGMIPNGQKMQASMRLTFTRFSGIGQGQVLATPIQMANVVSTIARNGVWMPPRLVPGGVLPSTNSQSLPSDRVDLKLAPAAIAEAKQGMFNVVNAGAGTGRSHDIYKMGIALAAKTGSAQASPLRRPVMDPSTGKQIIKTEQYDPQIDKATGQVTFKERKVPQWETLQLGTHAAPNPLVPWYRGSGPNEDKLSHAWYMGYAPADRPRIAFAVVVYYGGGGGPTAGSVAKGMLEELIKHKYLQK